MPRRKRFLVAAAVLAASLLASAAALAASARQASPSLLRVAATAAVTTWDPVKSFSTEVLYMANLYEPLVYANPPGAGDAVPAGPRQELAEERRRPHLDVPAAAGRDVPRR